MTDLVYGRVFGKVMEHPEKNLEVDDFTLRLPRSWMLVGENSGRSTKIY
jgi:hypothetical protein